MRNKKGPTTRTHTNTNALGPDDEEELDGDGEHRQRVEYDGPEEVAEDGQRLYFVCLFVVCG